MEAEPWTWFLYYFLIIGGILLYTGINPFRGLRNRKPRSTSLPIRETTTQILPGPSTTDYGVKEYERITGSVLDRLLDPYLSTPQWMPEPPPTCTNHMGRRARIIVYFLNDDDRIPQQLCQSCLEDLAATSESEAQNDK